MHANLPWRIAIRVVTHQVRISWELIPFLQLAIIPILEEHRVLEATGGTDNNTIRPAELYHEIETVIGSAK
jgi:hypothetical protein